MRKDKRVKLISLKTNDDEQYLKQLNEHVPTGNFDTPILNRKQRRTYTALRQREATKKRLGIKPRTKS